MPKNLKKVGSAARVTRTVSRSTKGLERASRVGSVAAKKKAPKRPTRQRSY